MNEKAKNFDFSKVDWSKYQDELNEIYQTYNELKKDRRFMRQFERIKKRRTLKVQYNIEKKSAFKLVSDIKKVSVKDDSKELYSSNCRQILPFS